MFSKLIDWLKAAYQRPVAALSDNNWVPVSSTPDGRMWKTIQGGTCPHCRKEAGFYEGPSGGMSVNIQCENCGWWFNVTPAIGTAESIGEKDDRQKRNPTWRPEI